MTSYVAQMGRVSVALLTIPASIPGKPQPVAAPLVYARAYDVFARSVEDDLPTVRAVVGQFVRRVSRDCPDAVVGAPHNAQASEVTLAILGVVEIVITGPEKAAMRQFIHVTSHLRWNDEKLARMVRRYNRSLRAEASLAVPDLCADLKKWVTGSFDTLPPDIVRVNRQSMGRPDGPPRLLTKYVGTNGKNILRRARDTVGKIERAELTMGLQAWTDIVRAVGLSGDRVSG